MHRAVAAVAVVLALVSGRARADESKEEGSISDGAIAANVGGAIALLNGLGLLIYSTIILARSQSEQATAIGVITLGAGNGLIGGAIGIFSVASELPRVPDQARVDVGPGGVRVTF